MPRATARDASCITDARLFSSTKLNSPKPATPIRLPDEALALGVAEHAPSEGHPLEDAAHEFAVLPPLRPGELRPELVQRLAFLAGA